MLADSHLFLTDKKKSCLRVSGLAQKSSVIKLFRLYNFLLLTWMLFRVCRDKNNKKKLNRAWDFWLQLCFWKNWKQFLCARTTGILLFKVCKQVGKVSAPHAFSCLRWPGLAFKCLYLLRRLALNLHAAVSISQLNRHSRGELHDTLGAGAHLSLPLSPDNERCLFGSRRVLMGEFGYSRGPCCALACTNLIN